MVYRSGRIGGGTGSSKRDDLPLGPAAAIRLDWFPNLGVPPFFSVSNTLTVVSGVKSSYIEKLERLLSQIALGQKR